MSSIFQTDFPPPKYIQYPNPGSNTANSANNAVSNPGVSPQNISNSTPSAAPAMNVGPEADKVELVHPKKEKKSLISSVSSFIGGVKKVFATIGQYSKGIFNGSVAAAVTGSLLYTGLNIINKFSKSGKNLPSKAIGIAGAVVAFGINMYKAYLNTNDSKGMIDHRYR